LLIVTEIPTLDSAKFNRHSMVGPLKQVLVCSPRSAGWEKPEIAGRWRELGFLHAPDFRLAQAQHDALCRELETAGAEVICLPEAKSFSLDAVYAHDSSFPTDFGVILMNPGKANRCVEPGEHKNYYAHLGLPIFAEIRSPATTEAGDIVWLDSKTLLIGRGYRTTAAGIAQMRCFLRPKEVDVIAAPLPYGTGPSACLHLMSLMSLLDEHTALVDLAWLAVETVELLRNKNYEFIEIRPSERETLACNVLALGNKRLLCLEENNRTNERLARAGFDVRTFAGSELCINGSGGPTCLTRPLARS
jgi:N-dimethylarginine dimethylaminohydrolase